MSQSQSGEPSLVLKVLTPDQVIYEGTVKWIQAPLSDGLIGIWPGHARLIASLVKGVLRYEPGDGPQSMEVGDGILFVTDDQCAVLVSTWEASPEVPGTDEGAAQVDDLEEFLQKALTSPQPETTQGD